MKLVTSCFIASPRQLADYATRFIRVYGRGAVVAATSYGFIALIDNPAVGWPLMALGQPAMPVIGVLDARSPGAIENSLRAFRQRLKKTGYIEGENVALEYRWGENS
jgi:hypothetical protein